MCERASGRRSVNVYRGCRGQWLPRPVVPYYGRVPFGRVSSERLSALPCAAMIVANDPYALPVLAEGAEANDAEALLKKNNTTRRGASNPRRAIQLPPRVHLAPPA